MYAKGSRPVNELKMLGKTCPVFCSQQNGTSTFNAMAAAFQQWVKCDMLSQPVGEELCAWAAAQNGSAPGSSDISVEAGTALLSAFLGNASRADAQ